MDASAGEILAILVLVGFSAIFSGMESALFSLSEVKLRGRAEEHGSLPKMLALWLSAPNRVLAAILVGNNLANITASALATDFANGALAGSDLAGGWAMSIAVGVMTFLILVAGEVVPKTVAKHNPEKYLFFLPVLHLTYVVFYVPTRALEGLTRRVVHAFGGSLSSDSVTVTEEDIETMVRIGKQDGSIAPEATRFLTGVLELDETLAREIMVPRTDVVGVPMDASVEEVIAKVREAGFSRFPAYEGSLDKVVGVLYAKDLLVAVNDRGVADVSLHDIVREPLFRPGNIDVQRLLVDMKRERVHMVMLVSEYGGIAGVVTLEDIVEEVFGPIYDEHDGAEAVRAVSDSAIHVPGICTISDLRNDLGVDVEEDEDYTTVAGLLMRAAGEIPNRGFVHVIDGWRFEVVEADETRILDVEVRRVDGGAFATQRAEGDEDSAPAGENA